ncbi:MAG: ATP-binding protein [Candidatus Daviesbacteria bacterium]
MHPVVLLIIAAGDILLGLVALLYLKRYKSSIIANADEAENRERQLKQKLLELQVLRSLGERAGYSLDVHQILEVIIDSLEGLVEFDSVAYALFSPQGKIILKTRLAHSVSRQFVTAVKEQIINAFSAMTGQSLQPSQTEEIFSGNPVDELGTGITQLGSYFNLPLIIGGKAVALINVSSTVKGLYADEHTAILYTILAQVSDQATKLVQVVENEKSRLGAMISSLIDGVAMVDPSFNLIVANPALVSLTGGKELLNLYNIMVAVEPHADLETALHQSLEHQTVVNLPEFELNDKAVELSVEPVKDKYGYLLGAAIVFHDMTAQKQLERLREEFTAMMVHELRTPLTTIAYSIDMMNSDLPKLSVDQISQNLGIINLTATGMLSLVNELMDVAKIEAGKFQIVPEKNDLKTLIDEKIAEIKPLADQKKLQLISEIGPNLPLFSFDKNRLGQTLGNLLSNAIKYTDQEGDQIKVKAQKSEGEVLVSVSDTGAGIKAEDIPKLFSKFKQLGKGKTGEKGGTGLGLVIAKGIVEAHGGKIWAESEGLGKGTTFTFSLPLHSS